jgi:hypothetical protein
MNIIVALFVFLIVVIFFLAFLNGRATVRNRYPKVPKPPIETYRLLSSFGDIFAFVVAIFMLWMIISNVIGIW